jgi:hypothetical protein
MKATASPREAQGEFSGIAVKGGYWGRGFCRVRETMWAPITYFKGTFGGGEGHREAEPGLCILWEAPDTHSPAHSFCICSRYIVIMVMCSVEIGSQLPLPLCSSLILEFLCWDNLKS